MDATATTHEKFIALAMGYWGSGDTIPLAKKQLRKAGFRGDDCLLFRFYGELPFAPSDREATEDEADCFVSQYGVINWVRCEREKL